MEKNTVRSLSHAMGEWLGWVGLCG